jgi:hypothetical protein
MGTFHKDQYIFFITSRSFLLRIRNVLDKSCRENQNTYFNSTTFFENRTVYDIMWKNIVERGRPQMTIWRMCIACWLTKATHTHTPTTRNSAKVVATTRLNITLHVRVYCQYCLFIPHVLSILSSLSIGL